MNANSPGWARLAQRIARRTTDLLAIAIVAAGVLSMSGRLTEWWATDSNELLAPARSSADVAGTQTQWGTDQTPVFLRLGMLPVTVQRQVIRGDEKRAVTALINACRQILMTGQIADVATATHPEVEQDLLRRLHDLEPADEAGTWRLYRLDQPGEFAVGSSVIGVRLVTGADGSIDSTIACWGFAMPSSQDGWTVFSFEKASTSADIVTATSLPPGARLVLSIADPAGGSLSSIEKTDVADVPAELSAWRRFFTNDLTHRGWLAVGGWRQIPSGWSTRFERSADSGTAGIEIIVRDAGEDRVFALVSQVGNLAEVPEK